MGVPSLQMSKADSVFLRSEISSMQACKANVWQQMFQQERLRPAKVNLTPPEMTAFASKSLGQ